jgi:hypothetical protein
MEKLTEVLGFQKLGEIASASETKDVRQSIAGVIREQLEGPKPHFDMYEPKLIEAFQNLGPQAENFMANIRAIPFRQFFDKENGKIKEFLASSGTTGIQGAYYLIPVKLWTEIQTCAAQADIVSAISKRLFGPDEVSPGTTTKVDILKDGSVSVSDSPSGASAPLNNVETLQATLDFTKVYKCAFSVAGDLREDANWDILQLSVQEAGKQCGEKSSDLALTILATPPDGDGTLNSVSSTTANTSKWIDTGVTGLRDVFSDCLIDGFLPNTIVVTHHAMIHSIIDTAGATNAQVDTLRDFIKSGFPIGWAGMNVIYADVNALSTNKAFTTCKTVVFDKNNALITGRKRWLRVENYSDPISDLSGAVVSFRQDSITVYKDAIGKLTES